MFRPTVPPVTPPSGPEALIAAIERRFPMPEGEIKRLEARKWILSYAKPGGIGAEIGVFRGHFSILICEIVRPRKLYLIDPWTKIGPTFGWGKAYTNFDTLTTEAARDEATARVALFPQIESVVIEDVYPTCAAQIKEPLDFAYLDAGHKYENTAYELKHLDAQMAPDGIILGDDWYADPTNIHHGVFRAVQDFTRQTDWQIIAAGRGGQWALRRRLT